MASSSLWRRCSIIRGFSFISARPSSSHVTSTFLRTVTHGRSDQTLTQSGPGVEAQTQTELRVPPGRPDCSRVAMAACARAFGILTPLV